MADSFLRVSDNTQQSQQSEPPSQLVQFLGRRDSSRTLTRSLSASQETEPFSQGVEQEPHTPLAAASQAPAAAAPVRQLKRTQAFVGMMMLQYQQQEQQRCADAQNAEENAAEASSVAATGPSDRGKRARVVRVS